MTYKPPGELKVVFVPSDEGSPEYAHWKILMWAIKVNMGECVIESLISSINSIRLIKNKPPYKK
jgi:hypothetical protein